MKKYLIFALLLLLTVTTQAQQNNKRAEHRLTIKYLYASDLSTAAPDSVQTLGAGRYYSVESPAIADYTPDKPIVEGTMPDHDLTETVKYYPNTCTITVDAGITHGTVTTSPSGEARPGTEVTVTATPDQYYELSTLWVYKKGDESQTVTLNDNVFVMPQFNVFVTATFNMLPPVINGQITPQTICAGEALTLTAPTVTNAERQGWEICPDEYFQSAIAYTNQTLDASYNGWKLRFWASNEGGISYSNVVSITVSVIEPELTGDLYLCTQQSGTYTVGNVGNATLTWTVSDQASTVTESGRTLKVNWVTAGQQTVTLNAVNEETGCSAEVKVTVNVVSYINNNDVQQIVAKKDNGRDYILIYPNPKENYKYQWYKDGQAINGATGQYYYQQGGLDAGAYKVYLSLNADAQGNLFGGAFTNEYVVKDPNISLSPNPVQTGESVLIVNNNGEATMSVYTLDGRLLHQQTINGTTTLNLNLAQGIYLIKLNDHQNEYIEKLIVK
ncbi:MAG: T9SS type A sorting domain-containing protein [Bacteroidales bacterium]|nr:T9SS type A sorting domain-containing protein [Bacteroidales bacterium]